MNHAGLVVLVQCCEAWRGTKAGEWRECGAARLKLELEIRKRGHFFLIKGGDGFYMLFFKAK